MKLYEAMSQRIQNLLAERDYKPYDLYKKGGIPRPTLSQVINCTRKRVSVDTIYQICATLEISLGEFFSDPIFDEVDD